MPPVQHHVIRRQVLRVDVLGAESDGLAVHRRLSELCRTEAGPALDGVLEQAVPADEHWSLDRLDIDAGTIALENLERDFTDALAGALDRWFSERAQPGSGRSGALRRRPHLESVHEALLHFLGTGTLPWWFHLPDGKTFEEIVLESWRPEPAASMVPARIAQGTAPDGTQHIAESFVQGITDAIGSDSARARLVRQFSTRFLSGLLARLSQPAASAVAEVLAALGVTGTAPAERASAQYPTFGRALWLTAFAAAAAGRQPTAAALVAESLRGLPGPEALPPTLRERLERRWPGALRAATEARAIPENEPATARSPDREVPGIADDPHRENRAPPPAAATRGKPSRRREAIGRIDLKEGDFVGCAGLVLLHPFLPRFFEALGVAAEDKLLHPERALGLLYFLATGQRLAPEYELLLPKLLCNIPFDSPVESVIELTAAEEEEAAALLGAVVRHWDALGDSSADALRGTFLARAGKLSGRDDGDYLLQVEGRSLDILLERLPWSIGIVELPWMARRLWVEWLPQ